MTMASRFRIGPAALLTVVLLTIVESASGGDYGPVCKACGSLSFNTPNHHQTIVAASGVDGLERMQSDRHGLSRDTRYFLAYQFSVIGLLYAAPESVSSWTDEQKEDYSLSAWWDNVNNPEWDSDAFYLNYMLHPYWGAAYFVRAKERGYSDSQAFWYSALLSSSYEFGAEALFEEPSIQDLVVTPMLGSLLGHYFMAWRDDIRDREETRGFRTTREKWLMALTDPLGSMNAQFDRLFGWEKSQATLLPYYRVRRTGSASSRPESEPEFGIRLSVSWQ